ncbi:hypothetical protein H0H87_010724 [Tephrocybe sp. NHM501043]|nr:hypothetical protein H0H87_010724 [Tephrocybe sp. NHM501043]
MRISIVTTWMENGDINIYLKKYPGAPRQNLASDVGNGLLYLHEMGIIHGDLKGVVAWTSQSAGASKGGSVRWQAPELFDIGTIDDNDEEVEEAVKNTFASDIYALGCVLYEVRVSNTDLFASLTEDKIFTGDVPFASIKRDNTVMLRVKAGARPASPPLSSSSWVEWGLTKETWACMEDCWNGQPSERPTASTVAQRLAAQVPEDTRQRPDIGVPSPTEFRRRMSEHIKIITIADLNRMLGIAGPPPAYSATNHLQTKDSEVRVSLNRTT